GGGWEVGGVAGGWRCWARLTTTHAEAPARMATTTTMLVRMITSARCCRAPCSLRYRQSLALERQSAVDCAQLRRTPTRLSYMRGKSVAPLIRVWKLGTSRAWTYSPNPECARPSTAPCDCAAWSRKIAMQVTAQRKRGAVIPPAFSSRPGTLARFRR